MTVPGRLRPPSALRAFLVHEAAGDYVLMAAALALVIANSPLASGYFAILKSEQLAIVPLAMFIPLRRSPSKGDDF